MTLKVLEGDGLRAQDITAEMAKRIKALIYEYEGRTTVPAVIGVLTIVQLEVIEEMKP
jgi:hypothetical protein